MDNLLHILDFKLWQEIDPDDQWPAAGRIYS